MKKFLLRLLLLFGLYLVSVAAMFHALPYQWGSDSFSTKLQGLAAFEQRTGRPADTWFVGSSLVYRQVSPALFDSVCGGTTHSFNLGCQGVFFPETAYLLDNIERTAPTGLKTVVAEITFNRMPGLGNLKSWQGTYFMDGRTYRLANGFFNDEPRQEIMQKVFTRFATTLFLAKNLAGFGLFRQFVDNLCQPADRKPVAKILGPARDGWYPLDDELAETNSPEVNARLKTGLEHTADIEKRFETFKSEVGPWTEAPVFNEALLAYCSDAIQRFARRGIRLVFFVPVRDYMSYPTSLPVIKRLPAANRFVLADPEKHPGLFIENTFDPGHLNKAGACEYTRILASEFLQLPQ